MRLARLRARCALLTFGLKVTNRERFCFNDENEGGEAGRYVCVCPCVCLWLCVVCMFVYRMYASVCEYMYVIIGNFAK